MCPGQSSVAMLVRPLGRCKQGTPVESLDSDRMHDRQLQRARLGFEKESTTIRVGKYKIKFGKGKVDLRAHIQKLKERRTL